MLLLQNTTITEQNVRVIALHVLATKFCTKASVPIDTPIPIKPSGQKEARV
jgi:hypothetical protein